MMMRFKVGDSASLTRAISDDDIRQFADLTGDHNPVHLDDEAAAKTRFGRRIAHGMLGASLISTLIASELPGPGSIYLGQTLKFLSPVYPGDTLTVTVTVAAIKEGKPILTLETICTNQDGTPVIAGEAVVLVEKLSQG